MTIDVCVSPALYSYYRQREEETIVVVVDIFRATSSMCAAFMNGVGAIIPVAHIEDAREYKQEGYLVGAERNVKRCDFADFGNSPFDYSRNRVEGKKIVMTTTNGTQAIEVALNSFSLLIGAFSNITAVAHYCINQNKPVVVLCSGWNNRFNLEDTLFAGALCNMLCERGFSLASDAGLMALDMWKNASADVRSYLNRSEHIERLLKHGLEADIEYCLRMDVTSVLPIYCRDRKAIVI